MLKIKDNVDLNIFIEKYVSIKKMTFEFDDISENQIDIKMIVNRIKLYRDLLELSNYRRELYKYEERSEIPVEELINKLDDLILNDFTSLIDC